MAQLMQSVRHTAGDHLGASMVLLQQYTALPST